MNLIDKYAPILEKISKKKEVNSIIIFGSYAKNKIKPMSDLDICIIFKKNTKEEKIINILAYGSDKLDISAYHKLPLSLQYEIITSGKIFKTKKDLTNLKIQTTNKWFDFKPTLNRLYTSRGYIPIQ